MVNKILPLAVVAASVAGCSPKTHTETPEKVAATVTEVSSKPTSIDVSYMDLSVKPQDDFFQFANGTWCKNNPVPNTESRWGSFDLLREDNLNKLHTLLDEAAADPQRAERLKALVGQQARSHARLKTATTGRDVALAELTEQLIQLLPKSLHPEPLDL